MKIFESYDGKPIKVFKEQQNPLCEVFMGDFFMSRYFFKLFNSKNEDLISKFISEDSMMVQ